MEKIFQDLQGIIVRALPTFFVVLLLYFVLKSLLFRPLEQVLEERRKRTLGAVEASEAALKEIERKAAEYEKALTAARSEIYQGVENSRKDLTDEQAKAVEQARGKASEAVAAAKAEIQTEMTQATANLGAEAERLSEEIVGRVLSGRAQA